MTSKKLLCACVSVVLVAILCAGCAGTPKAPPAVETGVMSADQVKKIRKAAEQGYAGAQFNLGVCYEHGTGVVRDETEAVKWYRKAAEQGNALAQYNFGACYYNGNGVPKDETEAVRWFRKAAEQGYEKSKEALRTLGADTLASAVPMSRAQTTPEVPKEEITVGCETVDRLGRRASVLNAFEMPEQAKADASVPMLLALQNLSPVQSNLVTSARGVVFTDAAATGSVFDDYGKTVASVMLKEGSVFKRGSITITIYRSTGLEAGVVMLKWDEHEAVFNYYVRPGFNQKDPFVRTANAEEAFSRLVWKRPANPTKQPQL